MCWLPVHGRKIGFSSLLAGESIAFEPVVLQVGILTEDEIRKKKQEEISKRLHEEAKIRLIRMNHKVEDHSIGLLVKLQIIIQW
jgi:hypothetical protein